MNSYYDESSELINISNSAGDDRNPLLGLYHTDSVEVAIFWEHEVDGGSEIWWANDRFEMQGRALMPRRYYQLLSYLRITPTHLMLAP